MVRRDFLVPAAILLVWTLGIAMACMRLTSVQRDAAEGMLLEEARALFDQVTLTQAWNARHGGVYVMQSPERAGNGTAPCITAGPQALELADGRLLARVDPPCMTRQLSALAREKGYAHEFLLLGDPDNPVKSASLPAGNTPSHPRPDAWDQQALHALLSGAREQWVVTPQADGEPLFRYMAPLTGEASCMNCHAEHRCQPDRLCGALRISLPANQGEAFMGQVINSMQLWFAALWVVGGTGLGVGVWLLVRSRRAALEAVRAKSDFLAAMSHELRTPLNGIIGLTDLVLADALSDQQREYLRTSRQSAERLHRLFTFMLEYARLDVRDRKRGMREPFSLDDCLGVLEHDFKPLALAKGLTFQLEVAPEVPAALAGDMNMLVVAVSQLLDNAVKFTETGGVTVRFFTRPCTYPLLQRLFRGEASPCCLGVTVTDTGPGIPKELHSKLFSPFFQGDASYARKHAGVGLGLALARRLAQAMGGDVVIEQSTPQGVTVALTAQFFLPE